jgi:hypothetical protein
MTNNFQGMQKIKLRNNYYYLKTFKDIFVKNNEDAPNLYTKDKLNEILSFAFGISDVRSIKAKFNYGLMSKIILVRTAGYSINPEIIDFFEKFVENNKDELEKIDLLSDD